MGSTVANVLFVIAVSAPPAFVGWIVASGGMLEWKDGNKRDAVSSFLFAAFIFAFIAVGDIILFAFL